MASLKPWTKFIAVVVILLSTVCIMYMVIYMEEVSPSINPNNTENVWTIKLDLSIQSPQTHAYEYEFKHKGPAKIPQPTLIVVGSVSSGTTTLNTILLYHFKHFFHGFKDLQDMHYWIKCPPLEYIKYGKITSFEPLFEKIKKNLSLQYKSWNVSYDNLHRGGCRKRNDPKHYQCNVQCTHSDYMEHIGYQFTDRFDHIFFTDYLKDRHPGYPNESISSQYYYWDRTSGYNSVPYVPVTLSVHYPHSKLIYFVRDPMSQYYSRIRLFDETTFLMKPIAERTNLSTNEANHRYSKLLEWFESDIFSHLISLLTADKQTDDIQNEIVSWYSAVFVMKRGWRDHRIYDICPYVNILLYVKTAEHYNKLHGINNFKIIQFEWETLHLLDSSIYLYCWSVFGYTGTDFENVCFKKYSMNNYQHVGDIMYESNTLRQNIFGKLKRYEWAFTNITIFDKLLNVFEICDMRLVELIDKYPSIVLGHFDITLWNQSRLKLRTTMLAKQST